MMENTNETSTMNKDPKNSVIGEIDTKPYDCLTVTWKIPNVTSLEILESTEVHSPQFSHKKAIWMLKLIPDGGNFGGRKRVKVEIERLHSEIPVHNLSCGVSFKSYMVNLSIPKFLPQKFDYNQKTANFDFDDDWYKMFYKCKMYRRDDTINLVVEFLTEKDDNLDSETKSLDKFLGPGFAKKEDFSKAVGELFIETFDLELIAWKIPGIHSMQTKVDECVLSPTYLFAGVPWILKLFLFGQMKYKTEKYVDVIIERLDNRFQKYTVSYKLYFHHYYTSNLLDVFVSKHICFLWSVFREGFFIFENNHTQENVLNLMSYDSLLLNFSLSSRQFGALVLAAEFRILKKAESVLNLQKESTRPVEGYIYEIDEKLGHPQVGEIIQKSLDCSVIEWKIPEISAKIADGHKFQSPQFSCKNATWIFKMNMISCYELQVEIHLLQSQAVIHSMCRFYMKGRDDYELYSISKKYFVFSPDDYLVENFYFLYSYYKYFKRNDAIILLIEFYTANNSTIDVDAKAGLVSPLYNRSIMDNNSSNAVGELYKKALNAEIILWKIPNIYSMSRDVGTSVQSPQFSFADASWNFKVFVYGRTKFRSEGYVDMVIERSYFQIPKHHVSYRIGFATNKKNWNQKSYSLEDLEKMNVYNKGSFVFSSDHPQENICYVHPYFEIFNLFKPNWHNDAIVLVCELQHIVMSEASSLIQAQLIESEKKSLKDKSVENPFEFDATSSLKEPPENKAAEKAIAVGATNISRFKDCDVESADLPVKNLLQDFKELFLSQEDTDVILNVKGQKFSAHKLILKSRCPVFASAFRNDMKEKASCVIDIEDCDPSSFADFLYFLYCGSTGTLSAENVFSLFTTADKYDVQVLRSKCLEFMKKNLSVDSFCDTIYLALQHYEKELIQFSTDFFRSNLHKIILTAKWQSFLTENPIRGNELFIKAVEPKE